MDQVKHIEDIRAANFSIFKEEYPDQYDALNKLLFVSERIVAKVDFNDDFQRVIGLTYTKGLLLLKSAYSIVLDGHGQEAGAILRILIESIEMIKYFNDDRSRIEQFKNDNLPSAGNIAKAIDGKFHDLRKHLNSQACHFSFDYHSISHIVDVKNKKLKVVQHTGRKTLMTNINMIITFGYFLVEQAVLAIYGEIEISDEYMKKLEICRKIIISFVPEMY